MSYILEALKKLEQKRQREDGTHNLLNRPAESHRKARKKSIWPFIVIALIVVNTGITIWLAGPWRTAQKQRESKHEGTSESFRPAQPSQAKMKDQPEAVVAENGTMKKQKVMHVKNVPEQEAASTSRRVTEKVDYSEIPLPGKPSSQHVYSPPSKPAAKKVYSMNELPQEIKGKLPHLKMSVHYYSPDPQARFIRVNDATLKQGQSLTLGLRVEEITAAGTIFSYQGYRFLIGINDGR